MSEFAWIVLLLGSLGLPGETPAAEERMDAARATLQQDLAAILSQSRLRDDAGVLIVSLDRGDTLFVHNPDLPLAPASNLKLFTTLSALYYLGPAFRYNTYLLATGAVQDGVLDGDLVLYGTGDPTLSDRFGAGVLDALADTLVRQGIREIRGSVVGDASYFGGPGIGTGWQAKYSNALYAAPASALSLSENIAALEIRPAAVGGRPVVRIAPGGYGIDVVNEATTVAAGRTRVSVRRSGYESPLTVAGQVSRSAGSVRYSVPVSDPALYAASALRESLESRGIPATGVRSVRDPSASPLAGRSLFAPALGVGSALRVLAIHTSPPLLDVLEVVNKRSNNFMAEQVLRTVGRVASGDGTLEGGLQVVQGFAHEVLGLDSASFRIFDGSGLSPLNRVTPSAFVKLLEFAAQTSNWNAFWTTLPQTGSPDGLRRMLGTEAQGRVRAKTGTINQVSALSGYVQARNGEWLAFSIVNNHAPNAWRAKRVEDAIVIRLAHFERDNPTSAGSDPQEAVLGGVRLEIHPQSPSIR
jgi:serine-type D-Ala-D-Ala carboxypeptidase/endopeptidase (penicillin-binding protein 4)